MAMLPTLHAVVHDGVTHLCRWTITTGTVTSLCGEYQDHVSACAAPSAGERLHGGCDDCSAVADLSPRYRWARVRRGCL